MSRGLRLWGVILSAGDSSRMGSDKALLPWPPRPPDAAGAGRGARAAGALRPAPNNAGTLLDAAILALKPFTVAVIVVAGANTPRLAGIAAAHGARLVRNPAPEQGQFSSLQTGLRALRAGGGDAAAITPVDCPPLMPASLERLVAALAPALDRGKWAVAPENRRRHGHPLLAGRELIAAWLAAPATGNARAINRAHEAQFEYVAVADAWLGVELNTPAQYAALAAQLALVRYARRTGLALRAWPRDGAPGAPVAPNKRAGEARVPAPIK
ncbi:MAG: nucleotidyltransferase family protein [Terriglobales bacterium]